MLEFGESAMNAIWHEAANYYKISRNSILLMMIFFVILFNDGHVLHLRPETIAIRKWMRNGFG